MSAPRLAELLLADGPDGATGEGGMGRRPAGSATSGYAATRDGPAAETHAGAPDRRPAPGVAGRGNLVRQAVTLLVHYPAAAAAIGAGQVEAISAIDRPGIPLLTELLAQLREDPPASIETTLRANGWGNGWRNGVYSYHHYHSTAHEVLPATELKK